MRWPWQPKRNAIREFQYAYRDALTNFNVRLDEDQAHAFRDIAAKEFRKPDDQARMIISDFIKDYNGSA